MGLGLSWPCELKSHSPESETFSKYQILAAEWNFWWFVANILIGFRCRGFGCFIGRGWRHVDRFEHFRSVIWKNAQGSFIISTLFSVLPVYYAQFMNISSLLSTSLKKWKKSYKDNDRQILAQYKDLFDTGDS